MSEFKYTVHTFEMVDTGIGQEMGFASDHEFLDHQAREHQKLNADIRGALDDCSRDVERRLFLGDGS